jgi:acid phosphatase (class A)
MKLRIAAAIFLLVVAGGCTSIATSALLTLANADYVSRTELDLLKVLPAPATPDSPATRVELEQMLGIQAQRSKQDCLNAEDDAHISPDQFAAASGLPTGVSFDSSPATRSLFRSMRLVEIYAVQRAKKHFHRERPFRVDTRLKPCIKIPGDESYPSGHSTWAFLAATVLTEIFPERRVELTERAQAFARSRVIGGVHFPSDIASGRVAGETLARKLLADPEFQRDLSRSREELLGLAPRR